MGKTKNSVIGRANRLGLPTKKSAPGMKQDHGIKPKRVRAPYVPKPRLERPPLAILAPPEPVRGGLHIMELKSHSCREVVGYGYPDLLARYCGCTQQKGSSYCQYHHARNIYTAPSGK